MPLQATNSLLGQDLWCISVDPAEYLDFLDMLVEWNGEEHRQADREAEAKRQMEEAMEAEMEKRKKEEAEMLERLRREEEEARRDRERRVQQAVQEGIQILTPWYTQFKKRQVLLDIRAAVKEEAEERLKMKQAALEKKATEFASIFEVRDYIYQCLLHHTISSRNRCCNN